MIYLELFYEFFITGLLMFGGGLASIPFLRQMAATTNWFTIEELLNMIAISESTPGPIAVNIATYAGFKTAGVLGGIIATIALLIPSFIIATIVAKILSRFRKNSLVDDVFYALRPASLGLIAAACLMVLQHSLLSTELWLSTGIFTDLFNLRALALAVVLFVAINKLKTHPVLFLAISAVIGIFIF